MDTALAPADRPRRTLAIGLAVALVAGIVTVAAVVGTPDQAEAAGLAPFTSCAQLEAWGEEAMGRGVTMADGGAMELAGDAVAEGASPTTMAPAADAIDAGATATSSDGSTSSGTEGVSGADGDTTNVVVEGVDELDLVERVEGDRWLATSGARLVLVDLAAGEVLAGRDVPWDAQVTFDPDAQVAWVVATNDDGSGVAVQRLAVGDGLEEAGRWTTAGMLVDARRIGDELHLVASEGFGGGRPFAEGPVPCDQVLHPGGPTDPSATLLVTLPVEGELAPVRSAEVVGSGQLVHVTTDAAFLATPQWDDDGTASTTIHRFDLASLEHTGSGRVAGSLLNDFSMSEHDGHLRVAITDGGGGMVGQPIPVDGGGTGVMVDEEPASDPVVGGDVAVSSDGSTDGSTDAVDDGASDPASDGSADAVSDGFVGSAGSDGAVPPEAVAEAPATEPAPSVPTTSVIDPQPTVPATTVPDTTAPEPTLVPTTVVEPDPVPLPGPTEPLPTEPTVPPTDPDPGAARNQVVVLDTEGDLDVVGQTERFGHPGETIHGIRFVGDTAYAVTFLTTDPFYVIDLADPTAPQVVGELELPGFSAYLHPMGDGLVVGFGPDGNGMPEAKLFDATDPAAPQLVDTIALGGDTPVTYDHHAFVDQGDGRFAVPVSTWGQPMAGAEIAVCEPTPDGSDRCVVPPTQLRNEVVELAVADGRLREVERTPVDTDEPATRAIPLTAGGWAMLAGQQLVVAGGPTLPLR
jgi:uncharacterized secreted protein with C-terminal beta-propeller domain